MTAPDTGQLPELNPAGGDDDTHPREDAIQVITAALRALACTPPVDPYDPEDVGSVASEAVGALIRAGLLPTTPTGVGGPSFRGATWTEAGPTTLMSSRDGNNPAVFITVHAEPPLHPADITAELLAHLNSHTPNQPPATVLNENPATPLAKESAALFTLVVLPTGEALLECSGCRLGYLFATSSGLDTAALRRALDHECADDPDDSGPNYQVENVHTRGLL